MAITISVDQTHRTSPRHGNVGALRVAAVVTDDYATASGGFTLNLNPDLAALLINPVDIVEIIGVPSATGHLSSFAKTSIPGEYTVKLWAGAGEIADGALDQSLRFVVLYNQGAAT